jgi:hypothetical protein
MFCCSGDTDLNVIKEFQNLAPGIKICDREGLSLLGSPIFDQGFKKLSLQLNSYLYHKARKCCFANTSTVCGAEAPAEAALVRAHFLAVSYTKNFWPTIYLKQNIIIFVKKLPNGEFIFLSLAT